MLGNMHYRNDIMHLMFKVVGDICVASYAFKKLRYVHSVAIQRKGCLS